MKPLLKIAAAVLFAGAVQTVNAQVVADRILPRVGIKAGANASNFFGNDMNNDNFLAGFHIGIFAKMPLTKKLSLMPELYYTSKGAEVSYNNSFVNGDARFRLHYLELPVLLTVNLTRNFNIHGGPYISYLLDGDASNNSKSSVFDFAKNVDVSNYNRMDAGAALGVAVDVRKFSVGLRYTYGITKIGKERNYLGTNYTFPDARNSVLNLYASISLN